MGIEYGTFHQILCNSDILTMVNFKSVYSSSVDLSNYKKVVSGGVASNKYVRTRLNHVAGNNGLQLVSPPPSLCTDNGNKLIENLVTYILKYISAVNKIVLYSKLTITQPIVVLCFSL